MRRKKRFSLIGAAALAVGLISAPSALGDAAADNASDAAISVYPNLQDNVKFGKASLFAQVQTLDANGAGTVGNIHNVETEKINMHFDDSIRFTFDGLKRCSNTDPGAPGGTDDQALAGTTTQQALSKCAAAHIGSGSAKVRVPTPPASPVPAVELDLTVTAFAGPNSTAGGGFDGGNPTVLLHSDNNNDTTNTPTTVVIGEIRNSSLGADFGKELNVPDAPDVGGSGPTDSNDPNFGCTGCDGALSLFNSQLAKTYKVKKGDRKITRNLITARCDDVDQVWDMRTQFTYDDNSSEFDSAAGGAIQGTGHNCAVK